MLGGLRLNHSQIMKEELKGAVKEMKAGKATGFYWNAEKGQCKCD